MNAQFRAETEVRPGREILVGAGLILALFILILGLAGATEIMLPPPGWTAADSSLLPPAQQLLQPRGLDGLDQVVVEPGLP